MNLLRLLVSLAVVALLVAWLATALCAVPPGEVVVVRRLGQPLTPAWGPGLHLGWPAPFEQRDRLRLDQIRRLAVGPLVDAGESMGDLGEFLTADHNLLVARAAVQYRIRDPFAFLLTSSDPDRA
ncbi:MAG: hypothetical protein K6U89_19435, partial [Chloroflexi bacterium]|nr:hypothetical protein [Chloroflexota bacterium]